MPKYSGNSNPAGGSGNSSDAHGKSPGVPAGSPWPADKSPPGVATSGGQTGSNRGGKYGSSH